MGTAERVINAWQSARAAWLSQFTATGRACQHAQDYGWPEHPTFNDFYNLYKRNGLARAVVQRPVQKTWQSFPWLLERQEPHEETTDERRIRQALDRLSFWQKLSQADEKSRVGEYGALILRIADSKNFDQPVQGVTGGLDALVELIPVYEEQLQVSEWDTDQQSTTYGQPLMYQFNESAVESDPGKSRSFLVHPDRVHIWSDTGGVHGESALEACLNALLDYEKVRGAGGAGFWKNAKAAPIFTADEGGVIATSAQANGMTVPEFLDEFDKQTDEYNRGFDTSLLLQAMKAQFPNISLPDPTPFLLGYIQEAASTIPIPTKILIGSQSGERASTEDANEWAETIKSRQEQETKPNAMRLIRKLMDFRIFPRHDYYLDFGDITESSMEEKVARAEKMANINKALMGTGEVAFTADEIRESMGYEAADPEPEVTEELEDGDA